MKYHKAQDTFVLDLPDGSVTRVVKGEVRPESDAAVRHDAAHGAKLFLPLDAGEEEQPAPQPAKAAPVRPAAKARG